jgi:branched-subunit amino acid aminotransferase/4-amino-4-deoxychorismate lyase
MKVYLNGDFLDEDKACIPADDRGFLFGDALYESIRIYRGGFFRFSEHWERLAQGAAALKIEAPPLADLKNIAGRVAALNCVVDGTVRVTLTRGPGGEGLRTAGSGPPTLLVTVRPITPHRMQRAAAGLAAILARARRSPVGLPASIKSANRLDAIMARLEADEAGVDEAILLNADGYVAEGTVSNIFWRSGDRLCTPELSIGILPGVTRMVVLEVCRRYGIPVEEGRWPPDELKEASEIFLTMSSVGPVHVVELDSKPVSAPDDALFPRVRDAYWSVVEQESGRDPVGPVRSV